MQLAAKNSWGLAPDDQKRLAETLGRQPSNAEIRAEAVEQDYQRLKDWCENKWTWVYVKVTALDKDGKATSHYSTLGGIESDAGDYLSELAHDMANELIDELAAEGAKVNE